MTETPAPAIQSRMLKEALMPGETVVYQAKFHWFYTFSSLIILAFWMGMGAGISHLIQLIAMMLFGHNSLFEGTGGKSILLRLQNVPTYIGAIIGLFLMIGRILTKLTTEIYLTNKRLIIKRGVMAVEVAKMSLKEVNYSTVRQSWLGSLLGYGGLEIFTFTQDDKNILVPAIAHPHSFTKSLEMAKEAAGLQTDRSQRPPTSATN
jgi:hypothetical protein